jgi:GT2 family glycosyltransferase
MPFGAAAFGEDLRWGKRAIEAGYKLVYEPRSVVLHAHELTSAYALRRHYVDQALLAELFDWRLVPNLPSLVGAVAASGARQFRALRAESTPAGSAGRLAARHAFSSQAGVYLGGKGGAIGRLGRRALGAPERTADRGA